MVIVIGTCWTNFCSEKFMRRILATFGFNRTTLRAYQPKLHSLFCALFLKIALSALELMSLATSEVRFDTVGLLYFILFCKVFEVQIFNEILILKLFLYTKKFYELNLKSSLNDRFLRNYSYQLYLLSEFLAEICWEELLFCYITLRFGFQVLQANLSTIKYTQ